MIEPDVSDLLTVAEAIRIIDSAAVSPRAQRVALRSADGLVLTEEIRADRDYPPFDKSLMDGFAVRCVDASAAGAELRVVGEVAAGREASRTLSAGEAVAVMTGAPLPPGADGVVPVEEVERNGDRIRILKSDATPGRFISRRGSDVRAGEVVLSPGTRMGPAQLAVAASVGAAQVQAFARPRAAVLATGDELVRIDQAPGAAQIRNSNNFMLVSLLKKFGCDVTDLGVVRDDPQRIRDALAKAIDACDVLFVTGGMSMGAYDYVPRTLTELGVELKVTKLRIKPGKPFVFGQRGSDKSVFGLPGNPVSAFVCTVRLASRLVARLRGEQAGAGERWLEASLSESLPANGRREFYQPVFCRDGMARAFKWKGSADVFTLAAANGLLVRRESEPPLPAGAAVRVLEV